MIRTSRRQRDFLQLAIRPTMPLRTLAILGASLLGASLLTALAPWPAFAQGRVDAEYEATLAGIAVGEGAWTVDVGEDVFAGGARGGTAGLLKAFSSGSGTANV